MVVSDKSAGLMEALPDVYPKTRWQRCVFHFHRNVMNKTPHSRKSSRR